MNRIIKIIVISFTLITVFSAHSQDKDAITIADSLFSKSYELHNDGKTREAIEVGTEALNLKGQVLGKENADYAKMLHDLAVYNYLLGNHSEAIRLGTEALNIRKRVLGKENIDYMASLHNLALCYSALGNYTEAIPLETEMLSIIKPTLGKEHPDYVVVLAFLAFYHSRLGNYTEAIHFETEALNIKEQTLGKEHPDYLKSLSNLSIYYSTLGNYAEAIHFETEALNIKEQALGKEHPDYAQSLGNLANYYESLGNYTEAIKFVSETVSITGSVLGKEHPDYATSLHNLAHLYYRLGNYTEASQLETKALNIRERTFGKRNSDYLKSLSNLSIYYSDLGNYAEAIRLGTEALNTREQTLGKEHPDYVQSLGNLANYYELLGDYTKAIKLGSETVSIIGSVLGKEHPDYPRALSNLANYYSDLGNYTEAIRLGTEALNIRERILGKEHPDYAQSLGNLAIEYRYLSNYTEAFRLDTEALNIRERILGKEHPDYLKSLSNLALYHSDLGDQDEAIRLWTEMLNTRERILGKEHPDYALNLDNLAGAYCSLGNYDEAIRLGTEALNTIERVLGKEHPDYATTLKTLSTCYSALENYDEAIRLGTEAVNITEHSCGIRHPRLIYQKAALSSYYFNNNDFKNAEQYVIDINNAYKNYIRNTFANLASSERSLFWNAENSWFEKAINIYAYYTCSQQIISDGYDLTLFSKGILLNSERDFSDLIMESNDKDAIETFDKLRTTRSTLNKLYEKPIAKRFLNTDSLENVAIHLEKKLIGKSKIYGDFTHNMTICWKDIQKKLNPNDVAVEFVCFPIQNDSIIYAAYVVDSKMKNPKMITLFEARQLEKISGASYYTTPVLSRLVWSKLDNYISNSDNIYFAPAGELHNIAIESLPDYNANSIISDRHNFYRLSSTRQLAVNMDKNPLEKAVLYGGLRYNTSVEILEKDAKKYSIFSARDFSAIVQTDSLSLRGGASELPATKIEVEDIDRKFKSVNVKPLLYTDTTGTEASFKDLSGKKINIMHIATHGFYWTEKEARRMNNLNFLQLNDNKSARYVEDKALTRTGMLFSGANNALSGKPIPENIQDGILTAREISFLNLRGLDMVAMSACQTGLGEITGDGVFGLQRGFKKAGANSLLMSLWKVDDKATQMLMTKFYEYFLSGKSKLKSLTLAQKYLREYEEYDTISDDSNLTASQLRKKQKLNDGQGVSSAETIRIKPFDKPQYWAAFILLDALD